MHMMTTSVVQRAIIITLVGMSTITLGHNTVQRAIIVTLAGMLSAITLGTTAMITTATRRATTTTATTTTIKIIIMIAIVTTTVQRATTVIRGATTTLLMLPRMQKTWAVGDRHAARACESTTIATTTAIVQRAIIITLAGMPSAITLGDMRGVPSKTS